MIRATRTSTAGRTYPPEPLNKSEVELLLSGFSRRGSAGIRDRALTCVLWRTGVRISEGLALYPKDIDFDACTVRVLCGKGKKCRTIGIDAGALAVLQVWLDRRKQLGLSGRHPLFSTLRGGKMSDTQARASLNRAAEKAGIEKRVHPHGLRHTHASELRREGLDIAIISRQLGHSSISTTSRYISHLAPEEVIQAISARTW